MAEVIHLKGKRRFTLKEARALLPVIKRLTVDAIGKSEHLIANIDKLAKGSQERTKLEKQLNINIENWVRKIERLGGEAKGLWLVDFDFGAGYYCWRYGEDDINHYHGYREGFSSRRPLRSSNISTLEA